MKNYLRALLVLSVASGLSFYGCKKKQTQDIDNETQSSVDNAIADQEFTAILPQVYHCALNTPLLTGKPAGNTCDTLHLVSGDTLFGTTGHIDPIFSMPVTGCSLTFVDGKSRSGTLLARFNGKPGMVGTRIRISLAAYKADTISYSCDSINVSVVASSTASATFQVKVNKGRCENSRFLIKYNSDRTVTDVFADASPYVSVFGTATGTNRTGRTFTVSIPQASPLTKHASCPFIDTGVLQLTPDGYGTRSVNFGAGTCDADATFSVNDNTVAFKLK